MKNQTDVSFGIDMRPYEYESIWSALMFLATGCLWWGIIIFCFGDTNNEQKKLVITAFWGLAVILYTPASLLQWYAGWVYAHRWNLFVVFDDLNKDLSSLPQEAQYVVNKLRKECWEARAYVLLYVKLLFLCLSFAAITYLYVGLSALIWICIAVAVILSRKGIIIANLTTNKFTKEAERLLKDYRINPI